MDNTNEDIYKKQMRILEKKVCEFGKKKKY